MENISGDAKLFLNGSSNTIEEMENNKNGKKIVSTQRPTKRSKIENEAKTEEVVVGEEREEDPDVPAERRPALSKRCTLHCTHPRATAHIW